MDTADYVVKPLPGGRTKYLLLTVALPLLMIFLLRYLIANGSIPNENGMASLLLLIPLVFIWILSERFIYSKIHSVTVYVHHMTETNRRGKTRDIPFKQVNSVKRNWLGEWVVKDASGKTILRIEENMENRERLINRLQSLVQ